jgi:hypothetical protein
MTDPPSMNNARTVLCHIGKRTIARWPEAARAAQLKCRTDTLANERDYETALPENDELAMLRSGNLLPNRRSEAGAGAGRNDTPGEMK